jgi:hypothetical protein
MLFYILGNRVLHTQSKFHVFRSFVSKTRAKVLKYTMNTLNTLNTLNKEIIKPIYKKS